MLCAPLWVRNARGGLGLRLGEGAAEGRSDHRQPCGGAVAACLVLRVPSHSQMLPAPPGQPVIHSMLESGGRLLRADWLQVLPGRQNMLSGSLSLSPPPSLLLPKTQADTHTQTHTCCAFSCRCSLQDLHKVGSPQGLSICMSALAGAGLGCSGGRRGICLWAVCVEGGGVCPCVYTMQKEGQGGEISSPSEHCKRRKRTFPVEENL